MYLLFFVFVCVLNCACRGNQNAVTAFLNWPSVVTAEQGKEDFYSVLTKRIGLVPNSELWFGGTHFRSRLRNTLTSQKMFLNAFPQSRVNDLIES
jgi:hypothetical protein